jgi:hypothetical protein
MKKTSTWLYEGTKKELSKFMCGGETWEKFLVRASNELTTKKRKVDMEPIPALKSGKRTTLWVTPMTRNMLNGLRRGDESWDSFFNRLVATLDSAKVPRNPN